MVVMFYLNAMIVADSIYLTNTVLIAQMPTTVLQGVKYDLN